MVEQSGVKRKLAAILAADVVGYSRLMGADEEGTLKTLTTYREAMDAFIVRHGGRIVGTAGDSVLAEFASAIEAVRCSIEIQQELKDRNGALPEERRMEFRIGINLGDVMIEGDDLYGDGVNVAARLEGVAEPGGICISNTVFDQVRDRIPHDFEDLGEHSVKNITRPVRVYRVPLLEREAAMTGPGASDDAALALPDRPSIAVLPLTNMSSDPEQEYFSDGITEDIITELSRFPDLFVIARNSVFTYKGNPVKVQEVAQDLGVRYVLEGSVRKAGQRVRVTAQLIDAASGSHVWAERYDRDLEDIFAVQDEITRTIVGALVGKLNQTERARAMRKPTENLEAYDLYLRGFELFLRFTEADNAAGRELLEKAVELDPGYARVYGMAAWSHLTDSFMGWSSNPAQSLAQAAELAQKALAIDPSDNRSHWVIGAASLYQGQHERALAGYQRALELNPNDADVLANLGLPLNYLNRPEEAERAIKKAMRLNPHCPWWYYWVLGWSQIMLGRAEEAIASVERIGNPVPACRLISIRAYMQLGREAEARAEVAEVLKAEPDFTLRHWQATQPYKNKEDMAPDLESLRAAGLPD